MVIFYMWSVTMMPSGRHTLTLGSPQLVGGVQLVVPACKGWVWLRFMRYNTVPGSWWRVRSWMCKCNNQPYVTATHDLVCLLKAMRPCSVCRANIVLVGFGGANHVQPQVLHPGAVCSPSTSSFSTLTSKNMLDCDSNGQLMATPGRVHILSPHQLHSGCEGQTQLDSNI